MNELGQELASQGLQFTPFTNADRNSVINLISSIFNEHGLGANPSFFQDVDSSIYNGETGKMWVVKSGKEVVGVVAVEKDKVNPSLYWLKRVYLDSSQRGHGLGKKLVVFAMEQAKQNNALLLHLQTTDRFSQAVSLYKALGFQEIDRLGRKKTEIVMERKLQG